MNHESLTYSFQDLSKKGSHKRRMEQGGLREGDGASLTPHTPQVGHLAKSQIRSYARMSRLLRIRKGDKEITCLILHLQ